MRGALCCGLLLAACSAPAHRSDGRPAPPQPPILASEPRPAAEPANGDAKENPDRKHAINYFIGGSINRQGNNFSLGLDYEYRLSRKWGASAFFDLAGGGLDTAVLGLAAYFHPTERLTLIAGPGVERELHEGFDWLARVGGYYEFEAGEVTIAPALFLDGVEGRRLVVVVGLNFGIKF